MESASSTRMRRKRARDRGLCPSCCARKPEPGLKRCYACRLRDLTYEQRMTVARQWNVCCQSSGKHRGDCHERKSERGLQGAVRRVRVAAEGEHDDAV